MNELASGAIWTRHLLGRERGKEGWKFQSITWCLVATGGTPWIRVNPAKQCCLERPRRSSREQLCRFSCWSSSFFRARGKRRSTKRDGVCRLNTSVSQAPDSFHPPTKTGRLHAPTTKQTPSPLLAPLEEHLIHLTPRFVVVRKLLFLERRKGVVQEPIPSQNVTLCLRPPQKRHGEWSF